MFRTDTGNFNRFLTSIGLLLLAVALLIPYFYFRDTEVLRTSRAELQKLTPVARDALERRQHRSADLEIPVLVLSVLLGGGGGAAVFFGGKRLRIAQRKEDEAIERQARREDYEFQQLSDVEVEVRRDEQAQEAMRETKAAESGREMSSEKEPPPAKPRTERISQSELSQENPTRNLADVRYKQTRQEIARIEEKTKEVLGRMDLDRFQYFSEMQIVQAGGKRRVDLDGLFQAQIKNQPDVALELKVTRSLLRNIADASADRLLALLARYRELTAREAIGWLLFVIPEGTPEMEEIEARERLELEEIYGRQLGGLGRCTIVQEQDLDDLPSRFTEIFGS